jgi:hypothetical protein
MGMSYLLSHLYLIIVIMTAADDDDDDAIGTALLHLLAK